MFLESILIFHDHKFESRYEIAMKMFRVKTFHPNAQVIEMSVEIIELYHHVDDVIIFTRGRERYRASGEIIIITS